MDFSEFYNPDCELCIIGDTMPSNRRACIAGVGNAKSKIVVVRDSPTKVESEGTPRKGGGRGVAYSENDEQGELVRKSLEKVGFKVGNKGDVWATYTMKCFPDGIKKISYFSECYKHYLKKELEFIKPELILCMGKSSQQVLLELSTGLAKTHGRLFDYEGEGWSCKVMPLEHPFSVISRPGKLASWESDLARAYAYFKNPGEDPYWNASKKERCDFREVSTEKDLGKMLEYFKTKPKGSYLAVDVETSGLDDQMFKDDFKMFTIQLGVVNMEDSDANYEDPVFIIPFMSQHFPICQEKEWLELVKEELNTLFSEEVGLQVVAHNGKYDLKVLKRFGIEAYLAWDTMILWANEHGEASMSLKDIAYQVTDLGGYDGEMAEYFGEHDTFDAPPELLIPYGGLDVVVTRLLLCALSFAIREGGGLKDDNEGDSPGSCGSDDKDGRDNETVKEGERKVLGNGKKGQPSPCETENNEEVGEGLNFVLRKHDGADSDSNDDEEDIKARDRDYSKTYRDMGVKKKIKEAQVETYGTGDTTVEDVVTNVLDEMSAALDDFEAKIKSLEHLGFISPVVHDRVNYPVRQLRGEINSTLNGFGTPETERKDG